MTPSQPQYARRSRVHARAFGMHVPGRCGSQPCPSHTPDAQSVPARHAAPSAAAPAACAGPSCGAGSLAGPGSVAGPGSLGGAGSVGVAGSVGAGALFGAERGPHPISTAAISNSRIRMAASYTSREMMQSRREAMCATVRRDG